MLRKLIPDYGTLDGLGVRNPTIQWILSGFSENWENDVRALKGVWAPKSREFLARATGMRAPTRGFPLTVQLDWNGQFTALIEQRYPDLDFRELVALKQFSASCDALLKHTRASDPTKRVIEAAGRAASERLSGYDLKEIVKVLFHGFRRTPQSDLFGAYHFDSGQVYVLVMPCIVFGILANLSFLEVAVPTLAHELAHAYCHRGRDQDSAEWKVYRQVEPELSESLAEYYAWRFSEEAALVNRGILTGFARTSEFLPDEYQRYREWASKVSNEALHQALIIARRRDTTRFEEFEAILAHARAQLD